MKQGQKTKYKYTITHLFQPIYHLKSNNVIGYEALLRDASQMHASPVEIFKDADQNGYRNKLDRLSMKQAFETFKDEADPLFLNIFPSTLLETNFLSWWDENVPPRIHITLELLEYDPVDNWKELKRVTRELQQRGVKIAIDDMGQGYSFFQQWVELEPDYIKLDRYFADDLSANMRKQKIVQNLVNLLSDSTKIIIEGIENKRDLDIAQLLGVSYAQGYLLGKPTPLQNYKL